MSRKPRTWRDSVMLIADTKRNELHDIATNPHASWGWYARERQGTGFHRLEEAKADAARILGPVTWGRPTNGRILGYYGPEMTADEFLAHSATK